MLFCKRQIGKTALGKRFEGFSVFFRLLFVFYEENKFFGKFLTVFALKQKPRLVLLYEIGNAADAGAHRRFCHGGAFKQHVREALASRRERVYIYEVYKAVNVLHKARENKFIGNAVLFGKRFERFSVISVAGYNEFYVFALGDNVFYRFDEDVVSLYVVVPSDYSDVGRVFVVFYAYSLCKILF